MIGRRLLLSASMGSSAGPSGALQDPQRPLSAKCFAGIRLVARQDRQRVRFWKATVCGNYRTQLACVRCVFTDGGSINLEQQMPRVWLGNEDSIEGNASILDQRTLMPVAESGPGNLGWAA